MINENKKVTPRRPSGFDELLPPDQILFNEMQENIRKVYESFGYLPIETPAIELSEVLLAKGGGETEKQIYRFTKGDTDIGLRFDLTIPLARYVAEHFSELSFPFRRYQIQKVWRAEKSQRGRYREFLQCDIDIIGSKGSLPDAEMLIVASQVFKKLNIDVLILVNNRKILSGILIHLDISELELSIFRISDKLEKEGRDFVSRELAILGLTHEQITHLFNFFDIQGSNVSIFDQLLKLDIEQPLFIEGINELRSVIEIAQYDENIAKNISIDLTISRGLDYYTGTVFETTLIGHPEFGSICSGGRYDDLVNNYTDKRLSGVGISIGLSRLFAALKTINSDTVAQKRFTLSEVLIVYMSKETVREGMIIGMVLRSKGIKTETYPQKEKIGKQLDYANKLSIPFVILIGEEEVKIGKLTLRDMETGEQLLLTKEETLEKILASRKILRTIEE